VPFDKARKCCVPEVELVKQFHYSVIGTAAIKTVATDFNRGTPGRRSTTVRPLEGNSACGADNTGRSHVGGVTATAAAALSASAPAPARKVSACASTTSSVCAVQGMQAKKVEMQVQRKHILYGLEQEE
jgi:hypothetical protein